MTKLMTVKELARYLRVTKKTIYRLLKGGKIPATKIGRQWRFDRASIDRWLGQNLTGAKANILIVDDEDTIRALFTETLEEQGHTATTAKDGFEGLQLVKQQDFALVFLNLTMPRMNGAQLFQQIKTLKPDLPIIIITGYPGSDMMVRALAHGPCGVMSKPFTESDIIGVVGNFLRTTR
ncbi:Regulator of RpoS [subsurface metagenome]